MADHEPPDGLFVATVDDVVVGYTAVHPGDGEMYLLFDGQPQREVRMVKVL